MPERMGVDVWQIVAAGEIIEPAGNGVRVHVIPIVCGEDKPGVLPSVTVGNLEPQLLPLVQPQKIHGFSWQFQIADKRYDQNWKSK